MTEALWLRSLDEARERAKASLIGASPSLREAAALHAKVTDLTAALAESRARNGELETQLLASLKDQVDLREQVKQLAVLLKAEQALRAQAYASAEALGRELGSSRSELIVLAQRKLASREKRDTVVRPLRATDKKRVANSKPNRRPLSVAGRPKPIRTRVSERGRRRAEGGRPASAKLRS